MLWHIPIYLCSKHDEHYYTELLFRNTRTRTRTHTNKNTFINADGTHPLSSNKGSIIVNRLCVWEERMTSATSAFHESQTKTELRWIIMSGLSKIYRDHLHGSCATDDITDVMSVWDALKYVYRKHHHWNDNHLLRTHYEYSFPTVGGCTMYT